MAENVEAAVVFLINGINTKSATYLLSCCLSSTPTSNISHCFYHLAVDVFVIDGLWALAAGTEDVQRILADGGEHDVA